MKLSFDLLVESTVENIWKYYEDISLRKSWDNNLEAYQLYGDFVTGTKGRMKLVNMSAMEFELSLVVKNKAFFNSVSSSFGELVFGYEMEKLDTGIKIRHSLEIRNSSINEESITVLSKIFENTTTTLFKMKQLVETI